MSTTTRDDASLHAWDEAGALSIVVQGALFQGNLVETAIHCRHWRELFPHAEIILSVSITDVVTGEMQDGVFTDLRLVPRHQFDGYLATALAVIRESCDKVGLAHGALPLPPIKSDTPKANNMNLQIAAAQHGLALATGRHVLRIRSDMLFMDRSFLQQYQDGCRLPRGPAASLQGRVMISWLFTLNPFTVERMPLHFSDWFHFGLTSDVRRIWQVPPMTLRDAVHYRTRHHRDGSNNHERLFNVRIAVEQHLMYHCFKQDFPRLTLDYHNDHTSIEQSIDILIDNFVVCDLQRAHCVFEKYANEFLDESKRTHCITADAWAMLAKSRDRNFRAILMPHGADAAASGALVPGASRFFNVSSLKTRGAALVNGELVGEGVDGLLFYGPYARLPSGSYTATVNTSAVEGSGNLTLRVTVNGGKTVLARRKFAVTPDAAPSFRIPFHVAAPDVSDLEVVCNVRGLKRIVVSGLTISRQDGAVSPRTRVFRLGFRLRRMKPVPLP